MGGTGTRTRGAERPEVLVDQILRHAEAKLDHALHIILLSERTRLAVDRINSLRGFGIYFVLLKHKLINLLCGNKIYFQFFSAYASLLLLSHLRRRVNALFAEFLKHTLIRLLHFSMGVVAYIVLSLINCKFSEFLFQSRILFRGKAAENIRLLQTLATCPDSCHKNWISCPEISEFLLSFVLL